VLGDFQKEFTMSSFSYTMSSKDRSASQDVGVRAKEALKVLFELLEAHAPSWYTKEHHDEATTALH
jgi:hypothetical protein